MILNRLFFFALVLPFLVHCAGKKDIAEPLIQKPKQRYATSASFPASYATVLAAVQQAIENKGVPISQTVSEKGLILTDWASGKSDRLFSGYGESKIPYTIRYKFLIKISPADNRTGVQIKSKEEFLTDAITAGSDFKGSLYNWMDTESTGLKESKILQAISDLISGKN